jgi:hypothetical protein
VRFALPLLSYPFPYRVSRFAVEVDETSFRWGERMGIFHLGDPQEYRRTHVGRLAATTCPRGTRVGLRLLADWQTWLFAFDDGYCDESEHGFSPDALLRRAVGLLGILEGTPPEPDDPFGIALADLWARLVSSSEGYQRSRFASAVNAYLLAQCWEAVNRSAGVPPALTEYVYMRRHGSAVRTCTALVDVAGGFQLGAQDYDHPDVVALTDTAINVVCWANDILSYPKELRRSAAVHSLPAVLEHEKPQGIRAAIETVVRMHDEEVARYVADEEPVRAWADPSLRRYLDDLRFWMVGNQYWARQSGRYDSAA